MVKYATLSQQLGADMFSVGFELVDSTPQAAHWRSVVAAVRQQYKGPIVYGANHDNENNVTWCKHLSDVCCSRYVQLSAEVCRVLLRGRC
jgi:hypothetical protein